MAVTRSLAQLAGDLRLGDGTLFPSGPAAVVLGRIDATARAMVTTYAPDAPDAIANEAYVRLAGWLYDQDPSGANPGGPNALRASGAASLLATYRVRRGGVIGGAARPGGRAVGGPGSDQAARDAAAANTAFLSTFMQRVRAVIEAIIPAWAREPDPPVAAASGVVDVLNGRLPGASVALRIGWSQSRVFEAGTFTRAGSHPTDGAAVGTTAGVSVPPFPPALNTDPSLYLGLWLAGDPEVLAIDRSSFVDGEDSLSAFPVADRQPLEVGGVAGFYYPGMTREFPPAGDDVVSVTLGGGSLLLTDGEVERWARTGNADAIPSGKLSEAPGALSASEIGDRAFSNPPSDLTGTERTAVRAAIGAGTGTGTPGGGSSDASSLTDAQIGEKAFTNPPTDLTSAERTFVRNSIGISATGQAPDPAVERLRGVVIIRDPDEHVRDASKDGLPPRVSITRNNTAALVMKIRPGYEFTDDAMGFQTSESQIAFLQKAIQTGKFLLLGAVADTIGITAPPILRGFKTSEITQLPEYPPVRYYGGVIRGWEIVGGAWTVSFLPDTIQDVGEIPDGPQTIAVGSPLHANGWRLWSFAKTIFWADVDTKIPASNPNELRPVSTKAVSDFLAARLPAEIPGLSELRSEPRRFRLLLPPATLADNPGPEWELIPIDLPAAPNPQSESERYALEVSGGVGVPVVGQLRWVRTIAVPDDGTNNQILKLVSGVPTWVEEGAPGASTGGRWIRTHGNAQASATGIYVLVFAGVSTGHNEFWRVEVQGNADTSGKTNFKLLVYYRLGAAGAWTGLWTDSGQTWEDGAESTPGHCHNIAYGRIPNASSFTVQIGLRVLYNEGGTMTYDYYAEAQRITVAGTS